ncbi:hypothetical protein SBOR_1388 [Sclerotinia borealis F-4128]|uniref:Protein kinase domain-containing protein n=1 Tax=Sclerotinia borealis (strain F-4128) TaxID=1432307 RepID=W9CN37_SCLBF|nr:hypothetical protein SBOR_1388 [Sclerotinia borealis F-4128]
MPPLFIGESMVGQGSWSMVFRSSPRPGELAFRTEISVLPLVIGHPRIIEFGGVIEGEEFNGLLFKEYANGDLATYIQQRGIQQISKSQRLKWCRQTTEALVHIHSKNVAHCDLLPGNLLLDDKLDLYLADFGSAFCEDKDKGIDGGMIPDAGFFDPNFCKIRLPYADIKDRLILNEDSEDYQELVFHKLQNSDFPDLTGIDIEIAKVIDGCWSRKFQTTSEVLVELQSEL